MKTLYIIGNGFDIHHGLNTGYQLFAAYLAEHNAEVYELLLNYYFLPDITDPCSTEDEFALWSRFEAALADLDYESVLNDNTDYLANPGAEEFRDRDWHAFQIQMELIIAKLTTELIDEFNNFILDVSYPDPAHCDLLELDKESFFLSFNYTETLQHLYGIDEDRICYIHDKANKDVCSLILGHGTDPDNFTKPKKADERQGLSEEEYAYWIEQQSDEYDWSYDSGEDEILRYYTDAFKNTAAIIGDHLAFFTSLTDVANIVVLGHSLGEVDVKYFEEIKACTNNDVIWTVSFFGDKEKGAHRETLLAIGVPEDKITQIQMSDLVVSKVLRDSSDSESIECEIQ